MNRQGLYDPNVIHSACGVGAIVDLDGGIGHTLVEDGFRLLKNLGHRGARGADPQTGDGAGMLLQKPHEYFASQIPELPHPDCYGVGQFFLPRNERRRNEIRRLVEDVCEAEGFWVHAWREVPTSNYGLGRMALAQEPRVIQGFFAPRDRLSPQTLDVRLYILRYCIDNAVHERGLNGEGTDLFYICSLDRRRIVYKGMLTGPQLQRYYPELSDERTRTGLVLVHSRFSTNTLGAWHLAHPHRTLIHNGEFNTLRGNVNWLRAREPDLSSNLFGADISKIRPVLSRSGHSDSLAFDQMLDLLVVSGRSLPHALRMLIPEAWNRDEEMSPQRQAFYEYAATLMEPWEGPALVIATDGNAVGAVLDRNGLRPCRYSITRDRKLILGSETGVLDLPPAQVREVGRLRPGQLLLADWGKGRIVPEDEIFEELTSARPYGRWLDINRTRLEEVMKPRDDNDGPQALDKDSLRALQRAFGYTQEALDVLLTPLSEDGKDPLGAMGDDAPLAALSGCRRRLFDYFLQQFAQVSNPPLDYIRESLVTSLESHIGHKRNLLEETPLHCRQLLLSSPVLDDDAFFALKRSEEPHRALHALDTTYIPGSGMRDALDKLRERAVSAIDAGAEVLILDDSKTQSGRVAIPSLLATAAVHHGLIRSGRRMKTALIVATGEAYAVHDACCLLGYGADAIYPWLAYRAIDTLDDAGGESGPRPAARRHYRHGLEQGILKVMSKMGIATIGSYKGAQIFEAIGLDEDFVDAYFPGTTSRVSGIGLSHFEQETESAHAEGFGQQPPGNADLASGGDFYWRRDGERHQWNPQTIGWLQHAARTRSAESYRNFAASLQPRHGHVHTLRDLLRLDIDLERSIPLEQVEPVESIMARFFTGSMSFGALSREAHETLAIAMNRIGAKAGSGEGGEQVDRFGTEAECSIKQVASGRFGVTARYLAAARQIEIKMAQGSKPGEGGELPGAKVGPEIAEVRFTVPGVGLISPPPHHDIYSIEDLAQLIHDLKCANPKAEIQVKLVAKANIGTIAAGVVKAGANAIVISGSDGGTGASVKTSIKHAGAPWELGLPETQQALIANRLRSRITLRVDGGLKTGRDVVVAALLGAEEFGFGTAALVTLGCIMLRKCHCNTCSVGIATQDPRLRRRFQGTPENLINYLGFLAEDVRGHMASLGFRTMREMTGRADRLKASDVKTPKGQRLDLSALLHREPSTHKPFKSREQRSNIATHMDHRLAERAEAILARRTVAHIRARITNRDRTVGTLLSYLLARSANQPYPDGTIVVDLTGSAGQSFGAFLAKGVNLHLTGDANDYVGKGLSGGRITIRIPESAGYRSDESIIVGNVALYGSTEGEAYFNGLAGERFCVRNSGAVAVVEGIGDHGCEYMTGGAVLILGSIGRNFGAGMSGGAAYLLDEDDTLEARLHLEGAAVGPLEEPEDIEMVKRLLENHVAYTNSTKARRLLDDWEASREQFVKYVPTRYAEAIRHERTLGRDIGLKPPPPATLSAIGVGR